MASTSPQSQSGPPTPNTPGVVPGGRPHRRRQRSVRVTVAVTLLGLATAAVLLALPTQSPLWLSLSSVLALACGWAAARIVYTELVQSRRDNAADRVAQAQAYRSLFADRASEHAEFTTAMTDRLATRDREVHELESSVVVAQQRAAEAETRVNRESRRAGEASEKVAELQRRVEELDLARRQAVELAESRPAAPAAPADEGLAGWEGFETVVDLMAWEEKAGAAVVPSSQDQKHA